GTSGIFRTPPPFDEKKHTADTQRGLAFTSLVLTAVLYLGAGAAFIFGLIDEDGFSTLTSSFSAFAAITAATTTFYFTRKK
ncbi:hypothetical protein, partial [Clavibacter zhangzhiyongii]|uniref:hypothetical protein n=1 Tax=Clavibacter zhangzhiyongii TaxID=2768071 RepID=UPI001958864B